MKLKNTDLNRLTVEEFKDIEKTPIIIILENVRSLYNVGSIFRTSDAFRLKKIYLCGFTGTPPHKEINKTALGATDTVDWSHEPSTSKLITFLKHQGVYTVAVEQVVKSTSLHSYIPQAGHTQAFVFGNEVQGISEEVLSLVDEVIEVPQIGMKHSLNLSVCAGMVIWDVFSKQYLAT